MKTTTTFLGLLLLAASLLALPMQAQTIRYVKAGATGDGSSWAAASGDLQAMIDAGAATDQVWVAQGTYKPGGSANTDRTISFSMKNGVAIYGGFVGTEPNLSDRPAINSITGQPSSSTLSGDIGTLGNAANYSYHVIFNSGLTATAVLDGFVITGGRANGSAAGSMGNGGGMRNESSSPTLANCSFQGNIAAEGGGMSNFQNSSPVLINCSFVGNTSTDGGGMANRINSSPTLANCSFQRNMAFSGGGMTNIDSSSPVLTNCSFMGNIGRNGQESMGGAMYNRINNNPVLVNCVVYGNGGSNTFVNATLEGQDINSTVTMRYSLVEPSATGYIDGGNNVTTATSPFASTTSTQLAPCSPAINAGSNAAYNALTNPPTTDLGGNPRFFPTGGTIDMGAYEFQGTPARLYVKANAVGTNTGLDWANAFTDLQSALNYACTDNLTEIWVAAGTYKPTTTTGPDSRTISFSMKNGVAIYGGFVGSEQNLSDRPAINPVTGPGVVSQPSSSTLSGDIGTIGNNADNSYHVIYTTNVSVSARLDGFVITGGNANGTGNQESGGGMYNVSSNLTLANCLFQANSATVIGGGIYNESGSPSLTNCAFQNNNGGGIANTSSSSPTLTNCSFQANIATAGGGIANYNNSSPTLTNCSFVGNSAQGFGGGMFNNGNCNPTLVNCTFRDNLIPGGSGWVMGNYGNSNPVLVNCVLFDNGGSNTFDNNNGGSVSIRYSLLEASVNNYTDGGNNRFTTISPFASATSSQLSPCSSAINTGSNDAYTSAGGPATDLAGSPRFYNGSPIDMGAYEFQGTPIPQTGITSQPATGSAVCAGSTVTASVSVSGTVSGYQWYKDGGVVAGQTSATLTLTTVQPSNAGSYSVIVTGTCNSVTSTAFSLTVTPLPTTPTLQTASGQSSVTVTQNSASVVLIGGGCSGTINWSGPNNTSGTGNITVSTTQVGRFVYSATCQVGACVSSATSATVTVSAPVVVVTLSVSHQDADNNQLTNNTLKPYLQLNNEGTTAIPYGEITVRYWLTVENFSPLTNLSVYYAQLGTDKVKIKYVELPQPRQGALGYLEYSFLASAGNLAPNSNSGPIQNGIGKQDWTNFNEADDYSYANNANYTKNSRITAYRNGPNGAPTLIWGTEPAATSSVQSLKISTENKNAASTNTISTYLQVNNVGNVGVNYSDLKVRYYFTSEGTQTLNFSLDYAVVGSNNVKGQLVKINPPLANADTYLELTFPNLGKLYPLSGTGNIQYRIAKQDYSNFNQSNDYSYVNGTNPMAENNRVVIYLAGQRVYGTEPGSGARLGAEPTESRLSVRVLGNPVRGTDVSVEVSGAEGQPLQFQLTDLQGRVVSERLVEVAGSVEQQRLALGQGSSGLLLLQVSTATQRQTVKVLKQ